MTASETVIVELLEEKRAEVLELQRTAREEKAQVGSIPESSQYVS